MRKPILLTTGQKLNSLTYIGQEKRQGKRRFGLFKCDCGTEKWCAICHVYAGKIKTCGCWKRPPIQTGEKNNKLEFVEFIESKKYDKYTLKYGLFKCDCGNTTTASIPNFRSGEVRSCGCLVSEQSKINIQFAVKKNTIFGEHTAIHNIFCRYRKNANISNRQFNLTEEQFEKFIKNNCFYCGDKPNHFEKTAGGELTWNGIDRVDNSKGYFEENCVTCCGKCNRAKHTLTFDEFINMCKKVASRCL